MKKLMLSLVVLAVSIDLMALSRSKVREYARFLSDRMAYELRLSSGQYDDCYEINYDFINSVGDLLDDVEYGDPDAIDDYYRFLDYRNEDLSYVLSSSQYGRFFSTECFYRPFCVYDGSWAFRPYMVYSDRNYFYMSVPFGYNGYYGAHARRYFAGSFYIGRYSGPRYSYVSIRRDRNYNNFPRRDFGPVMAGHGVGPSYRPAPRPGRPQVRPDRPQPRPNGPQARPDRPNNKPNGSQVRPDRPNSKPNGSQTRPDRRSDSPQAQPAQNKQDSQRGGGGGVVRRGRG